MADDYSPYPPSCQYFLRCHLYNKFEKFLCPAGTLFDYISKFCDFADRARCYKGEVKTTTKPTPKPVAELITTTQKPTPVLTTTPKPTTVLTTTPKPTTVLVSTAKPDRPCSQLDDLTGIPDDCTKYIKCVNGSMQTPNCFGSLNFDFITEQCINPSDAICFPVLEAGQSCTDKYTMSPVPGDCTKYLRCKCGKFIEYQCPVNMNFDYKTKKCSSFDTVECYPGSLVQKPTVMPTIAPVTKPQPVSVCRPADGLFGLPEDCTQYKECENGQFVVKSCPDDFYFDQINQKCSTTDANCISSNERKG